MSSLTLQDLLEAGTHFGHQTKRWNPKMRRYILCAKNGIYIIDLNKSLSCLEKFLERVREEVVKGGKVLFVGTKKQLKDCIREEAIRCNMPYVTERWLGGMLTNFQTIKQSISRLEKIEKMETDGTFEGLPKKERQNLLKQKDKLLTVLSGIRHMRRLPALVFVVDTIKEHIAIAEARKLKIPIGAIVDTNCDPDLIDYPIPANDDAIKSVQLIARAVSDTILSVSDKIVTEEMFVEPEKPVTVEQEVDIGEEGEETLVEEPQEEVKQIRRRRVIHRKFVRSMEEEE
ncbi:MAG: 30S ribosomal protein S2 [Chitinispirillaceae bacterium]|nr:30S ribosomal protein S2 [Chitinispirillaceae bacterium]